MWSTASHRRVGRVEVCVWSPESIRATSVCEVNVCGTYANARMVRNGLNDDRMGPCRQFDTCRTCGGRIQTCPGHYGHMELNAPVFNLLFFDRVYELIQRVCPACSTIHTKTASVCTECHHPIPRRTKQIHTIMESYTDEQRLGFVGSLGDLVRPVLASEALARVSRLTEPQLRTLGFPTKQRPEWMITSVLPVAPPQLRPSVLNKGRWVCDDMTTKYSEILRANTTLGCHQEEGRPRHIVRELIEKLQWHISTLYDSEIRTKQKSTSWVSGESKRGLRQRLQGKQGRVRQNLMGKRVDFSARTVITADPNLDIDQVGVPFSIAQNLTVPERVTHFNHAAMLRRLELGASHLDGARSVEKANGTRYDLCVRASGIALDIGDIVERPLQDDDLVVMNRQPSLHKMSMMAHRVKRLPYSTFRLNLSEWVFLDPPGFLENLFPPLNGCPPPNSCR